MARTILTTLGLLALTTATAVAAQAAVTVTGTGDPAIDRQAIQDAIDTAGVDGVVELSGTFQLDGERIEIGVDGLVLRGARIDADGDGAAHEDWADGRDNDGDGAIDEDDWDAVLVGVTDPNGVPVRNDGTSGMFNRGFVVDGAVPSIASLTVRDLAFEGFHRAIELLPEWATPTGRCEDRVRVPGSMRHVRIENNRFTNNVLGVTLLGDVSLSTVGANVFERNDTYGAVVEGGSVRCPLADGTFGQIALATPENVTFAQNLGVDSPLGTYKTSRTRLVDNTLHGGSFSLLVIEDSELRVSGNRAFDTFIGIAVAGGDAVVVGNQLSGLFSGALFDDSAEDVLLADNEISGEFAVYVEPGASGYRIVENAFPASGFVDVLLDFGSHDNVVVNGGEPITVFDLGTDNRLLGNVEPF